MDLDPRLVNALARQLQQRDAVLAAGAQRIGFKLGLGARERIGDGPVVGHLTSASQLPDGASYRPATGSAMHADAEVAVELGSDASVAGFGVALELVDLAGSDDAEQIVTENIFHRAVVFGPIGAADPAGSPCRLLVNGEVRAHAPVPATDHAQRLRDVARLLAAVGEGLRPGDRLITGSVVQVPVGAGDTVIAELGSLGRAAAHITAEL